MWKPLAVVALTLTAVPAIAEQGQTPNIDCNIELNYTLETGPDETTVSHDGKALFSLNPQQGLFIDSQQYTLDPAQRQLAQQYQTELHQSAKQMVALSLNAVEVAMLGVKVALTALSGEETPNDQLAAVLGKARTQVLAKFQQDGDVYRIGANGINQLDNVFDEEMEAEIAAALEVSAGQLVWTALKAALTGGATLEHDAEKIAEQMEQNIAQQAEVLVSSAESFCTQVKEVEILETRLQAAIPQLAAYDLIAVGD